MLSPRGSDGYYMKVYLIRHGTTDWNEQGKIQGQADIPLNEQGQAQARRAARFLERISWDACFCSPLERARETARILLSGRDCPVYIDERLKEISYGEKEGTRIPLIRSTPGMSLYAYFEDPGRYVPDAGAESLEDLFKRCRSFLEALTRQADDYRSVLISGHGAWIRGAICVALGLTKTQFWTGQSQNNCCITLLEYCGGWRLLQDAVDAQALARLRGEEGEADADIDCRRYAE